MLVIYGIGRDKARPCCSRNVIPPPPFFFFFVFIMVQLFLFLFLRFHLILFLFLRFLFSPFLFVSLSFFLTFFCSHFLFFSLSGSTGTRAVRVRTHKQKRDKNPATPCIFSLFGFCRSLLAERAATLRLRTVRGTHTQKMKTCQKRRKSILLRNAQARNGHVRDIFIARKEILGRTVFPF
jgi:hypothetical protein